MKCSRCHDHTAILVNDGLCGECAFPRSSDPAAEQHAIADQRAVSWSEDGVILSE
jgi:hypothetical protein